MDASATTEQHSKTAFRSDVQVKPPEEVPAKSESITGVDIQKVERKFAVRNVTELVVDAGQQTDRGRETRSNDVDEPVRKMCVRDARKKPEPLAPEEGALGKLECMERASAWVEEVLDGPYGGA